MKKKFYVICMAFDGEYQKEPHYFETIKDANEYGSDLGSKWYFYPFQFTCSGMTIKDAGYGLTHFEGKRISTVQKAFRHLNDYCNEKDISMNAEEFWMAL